MGKAIRESSIRTRLGKLPTCECSFGNREKRLFLSVYVDEIKTGWKGNKTVTRCGKYSIKKSI